LPSPPSLRRLNKIVSSIEYIVYSEEEERREDRILVIQLPSYPVYRLKLKVTGCWLQV